MKFPKNIWNQLKNLTVEQTINALEKDGWEKCKSPNARIPYRKVFVETGEIKRVVIHFHPKKTYGSKLLMGLLNDIGWSVKGMERLKLIKNVLRRLNPPIVAFRYNSQCIIL